MNENAFFSHFVIAVPVGEKAKTFKYSVTISEESDIQEKINIYQILLNDLEFLTPKLKIGINFTEIYDDKIITFEIL
jgi:hypothetical protein